MTAEKSAHHLKLPEIYIATIIVAACSIIYELLLAQTLTLLYGGNVLRYSVTIGLYLFGLGIGAELAKFFKDSAGYYFIRIELVLSLIGGSSIAFLFFISQWQFEYYLPILILAHFLILLIGVLSGFEIPLLNYLLENQNFTRILSLDYIGSLIGSVLFGICLYSAFGLIPTAIFVAFLNFIVALHFLIRLRNYSKALVILFGITGFGFVVALANVQTIDTTIQRIYTKINLVLSRERDGIRTEFGKYELIENFTTPYQTVSYMIDTSKDEHMVFLDHKIQLGTSWYKIYHELFVAAGLSVVEKPSLDIAVLGGGDRLLIEELLRSNADIERIDHVDIDSEFMSYIEHHPYFSKDLNLSLKSNLVHLHTQDAYLFIRNIKQGVPQYDIIFIDLSSLRDDSKLIHLYSTEFYKRIRQRLKPDGVMVMWTYSEDEFFNILRQTTYQAGFKNFAIFTRRFENEPFTDPILVFTDASAPESIKPAKKDALLSRQKIVAGNWQSLKDLDLKENSVFQPNYKMIIERNDPINSSEIIVRHIVDDKANNR